MRELKSRVGGQIRFLSYLVALLALCWAAWAHSSVIEPGHTAMWYDPGRSGEGFVLEILHDDRALLYWYTYDDDGNQRWLQGVGDFAADGDGDTLEFPDLYITRGGRFGPNFDPDEVEIEFVGEAVMTFADCDYGTFSYSAFGQSQTINIQRLSRTMAAGCAPIEGVPGEPSREYAGQSGSWYDRSHSGEGYSLQWLSRDEALLTWYTYDVDGNQRWMIGVGHHDNGRIIFPMLQTTRGARFGDAFDPDDVERIEWGRVEMELECSAGNASYESILPPFPSGDFELIRLTLLARPACPWVSPKLTELYDITWNEIPIAEGERIFTHSIANNGTIAGRRGSPTETGGPYNLILWSSEQKRWRNIPGEVSARVRISGDGEKVLSTKREGLNNIPAIWSEGSGWNPLPGLIFDNSVVRGVSANFSHIVGTGSNATDNRSYPWAWNREEGQFRLPLTEDISAGVPKAPSNDGKTIFGDRAEIHVVDPGVGMVWPDGGDPELLYSDDGEVLGTAEICSHDCGIVFGHGLAGVPGPRPEAWYLTRSGRFSFLGELPDAVPRFENYIPRGASSDGRLMAGIYFTTSEFVDRLVFRAFIWTQNTGMVSIRDLLSELEGADDNWAAMHVSSVSTSGQFILISGEHASSTPSQPRRRAVVLELQPREDLTQF